jgi:hypothetical protein
LAAYRTEPARVLTLLLDVARSNDRVLKDPPPQWISDHDVRQQNQFIDQLFDLAA